MIKLLNILSEEIGDLDDNSVVGFEFKSMKPYRKKGRDGNYIPGYKWYVYFNGLKLVKGMWKPEDNFIVELTGNGEHFKLRADEFRYNQQQRFGSVLLGALEKEYPRLNVFGESDNLATSDKIRQALKIAFEDNWLEGDDMYSPGIRGIYTIGDKTGTDESWSVVNFFDTKKEIQNKINDRWGKEKEKGDFIYWLADVFRNDVEFMNYLVERQWESIYNGYENERKVSEILSNELGGDSQLFPPGSKKDRYESIDMVINGDNYQIKPSSSINKEGRTWKVVTYGMNNRYKDKNLQYIAYGTNDNRVYVFPNRKYNASDSRYVEHYEEPQIYPNNQLSEQFNRDRKLILTLQTLLNQALVSVNREDWIDVETRGDIDSIESIVVDEVFPKFGPYDFMVFATLNVSASYTPNYAYENLMYYMEMEINKLLPNSKVEFKIDNSNKNLSEQVNPKKDKLLKSMQSIIDQSLIRIHKQTEEMGLGEMEFINEIDSVESVKVKDIQNDSLWGKLIYKLYVDMYVFGSDFGFDDYSFIKNEIKHDINKLIPGTDISFTIIDTNNKNLSEQVNPKSDKLVKSIQSIVDQSLIRMEKVTEEMGLGEMEFSNQIDSVEGVKVTGFYTEYMGEPVKRLHLDMYVSGSEFGFDDYSYIKSEIIGDIIKLIPGTKFFFTIKDIREFGPGIDW